MKYGFKLWSNNSSSLFEEAVSLKEKSVIDFVELYIIPNTFSKKSFKLLQKIPITIHATHSFHGLNLAQDNDKNFDLLKEVKFFTDFFNAKHIIIHPGFQGSFETLKKNLKKIVDTRLLIENMPYRALEKVGGGISLGATVEEMKKILSLGFGFCLDFGHAIKTSVSKRVDYKTVVLDFLKLKPYYFHVTDGSLTNEYDEHFNLGEGKFDLKWIKTQIMKTPEAMVVFETPKSEDNLENDVRNIMYFKTL